MKFMTTVSTLVSILGWAQRGVDASASAGNLIPEQAGVKLSVSGDRITAIGSNSAYAVRVRTAVTEPADGSVIIDGRAISALLRTFDKSAKVSAAQKGGDLAVTIDGHAYRFATTEGTYPPVTFAEAAGQAVDLTGLPAAVKAVSSSVAKGSKSASGPISGVHVRTGDDKVQLSGTDSFRLVRRTIPAPGIADGELILPVVGLGLIALLATKETHVGIDEGKIQVDGNDGDLTVTIWAASLSGTYPNVDNLIASQPAPKVQIPVAELELALGRLAPFTTGAGAQTWVKLAGGENRLVVSVSAANVGGGEETIEVDGDLTGFDAAVNRQYFADLLAATSNGNAKLGWTAGKSSTAPIVVADDGGMFGLCMPIRV